MRSLAFARTAKYFIAVLIMGYATVIGMLKFREPSMVYQPARREVAEPPAQLSLNHQEVTYRSADGTKLTGWIIPARKDSTGLWLLICHGNYGNIGFGQRPEFYAMMRDLGLNLFVFDYRGFGASEGTPSEGGLYADAWASYRLLRDSLEIPGEQILIFGHSLGSAVAIDIASRAVAAGLIVEGAMTSLPDIGQERYPYLPVRQMMRNRFASIDKIGRVLYPKLFLHSPEDDIIPFVHSERLHSVATGQKTLVAVKGGHENAYSVDRKTYFGAIQEMVRMILAYGPGQDSQSPNF